VVAYADDLEAKTLCRRIEKELLSNRQLGSMGLTVNVSYSLLGPMARGIDEPMEALAERVAARLQDRIAIACGGEAS
jgi:hypothetical protein